MEEENQVLGKVPEAFENTENLESEDFIFYNQNKEEARNNIDSSAKDLTDFIDLFIQDVPAPSKEEIKKGKEKILSGIHSAPIKAEKKETGKDKKITLKVLFLAAVLSVLSVSGLFALGNSRNISIENGFMAFAKDTVRVVFFGEEEDEKYIDIDTLLLDLKNHGFEDIYLPEDFIVNSCDYKVSVPEYSYDIFKTVSFQIINKDLQHKFVINDRETQNNSSLKDLKNANSITINGIIMNVFEQNDSSSVEFTIGNFDYSIVSDMPYSDIISLAETLVSVEHVK